MYVREGRRVEGEHLFTAHDALPTSADGRPPVHANSITASHYALDSHAHRKREPGRVHLDGFLSHPSKPYTVPYGVIVPKKVEGLLTPVPVSGTHIGFSTLRMEPCWMALGQAAGTAAALSIKDGVPVRKVDLAKLQAELIRQKAVLIYFKDVAPGHPNYAAVQWAGLNGLLPAWEANPDQPADEKTIAKWLPKWGPPRADIKLPDNLTRGELIQFLYERREGGKPR